jgi:hypothetical protein
MANRIPWQTGDGKRLMRLMELLRKCDVEVHCAFIPGVYLQDPASMKAYWGERLNFLPRSVSKKDDFAGRWRRRFLSMGLRLKAGLLGGWP